MRGSKPVCLLCRLQVAKATSKTRAAQWQTQTARLSTTSSRRDAAGTGGAAPDNTVVPESTSGQAQPPPYVRKTLSETRRPQSNVRILQTKATREQPSSQVDVLFQQILQEQHGLRDGTGDTSTHGGASIDLSLVQAIGKLQEMVQDKNAPVASAYLYFRTEIVPAVHVPGTHVPQAYHKVKFALLEKVIAAKKADMFTDTLPTVADIFQIYAKVGELKPKQWTTLVGELVQCIVNMDPTTETQSVLEYERRLALREAMLADLVESWKVLSLPRHAISPEGENELTNGFWFPRLDKFSLLKYAKKGNFSAAFSTLFPQYPPNQLGTPVAVLAIATYALLHDSERCSVDVRNKATRFMSKVASLVTFVNYRDAALQTEIASTFPGLEGYVMGLWPKIRAYLEQSGAPDDGDSAEMRRILSSNDNNQATRFFNAASIGRRLTKSHPTRNSGEIDRLWEDFVGSDKAISEERAAQIRENAHLIDTFIKIRMMFNQPDKAIVAWNLLGRVGLKPSLRTWNLMLDGLRKAGNINGLKNIWAKLAKSGIALDTAMWTTRVAGLIECGDIEGGLHALEEMARLWERDPNKTAVKLTTEPVNAALTGLIRRKQHEAAEKLLAWAGRKGIEPDVFTFNTMLRSLIREGNRDKDVQKLIATMQTQGVRPDEATFTIVLDASLSKNQARDPEDQANIVADVASAMATAGLELNMQTYGKMIYLLLRSNATVAVMAIVNHLYNRNLELSPHIYTMLIEHCFAQNPPALDSVHLFVQRRRHVDFDDMDHIFYDRVIRGYTQAGETSAALDVYKHVVGSGASLSLSALLDLLRALLRQDRLQDARAMVNREKKRFENQNPDPEEHARYWGHLFWHLARKHDLLDSQLPSASASKAAAEPASATEAAGAATAS
ncbi:hypothetical protein F5B21DRAFT_163023 [Xylaria acuta]|nr:hypothetical protein F5B21DRAFT_163023 [Xylaria acuta]